MVAKMAIIMLMFLSILNHNVRGQSNDFKVTDFGAVADGKTDNNKAFMNAWKRACETDGGVVSVPLGTYFIREADFEGPCIGQTRFQIDGTLLASNDPIIDQDYWITFTKVESLTLSGNGTFDGNGANSWAKCGGISKCNLPPTTLKINYVNNSYIKGLHFVNSKMFHLHIYESENININHVHILAPEDSPNTDGIHVGNSNDVKIFNTHIATGDDCISMGGGSKNVNISNVWCGPGHGISIGSLGKYNSEEDVGGITVRNCTLSNTDNGLRIKTWARSKSSPVVSDVTFADININNVRNPIIIDQYYCPSGSCGTGEESSVEIKGVKFVDIKGTAAAETSVDIQCSKSKPCQDIEFIGLNLTHSGQGTSASCSNADDLFRGSNQVPSRCF